MHVLMLALAVFAASAPDESGNKAQDRTVMVSDEDRDMNAAMAKAQASLDDFLKLQANQPDGASDFRVKVKVTDENGSEHLWVTPFRVTADGFSGTVSNEPDVIQSVSFGEEIRFGKGDISDWGYKIDGKQKGSFTVCVLFKHMDKAEADRYRHDYGFDC